MFEVHIRFIIVYLFLNKTFGVLQVFRKHYKAKVHYNMTYCIKYTYLRMSYTCWNLSFMRYYIITVYNRVQTFYFKLKVSIKILLYNILPLSIYYIIQRILEYKFYNNRR